MSKLYFYSRDEAEEFVDELAENYKFYKDFERLECDKQKRDHLHFYQSAKKRLIDSFLNYQRMEDGNTPIGSGLEFGISYDHKMEYLHKVMNSRGTLDDNRKKTFGKEE